jgi:hypothetical protein
VSVRFFRAPLQSVSTSAFIPSCPTGKGLFEKYKKAAIEIIRIRMIEPAILKIFFHFYNWFILKSISNVAK